MSFILDALKKVEQQKRRGDGSRRAESVAMSGSGFAAAHPVVWMGIVALTSALLTIVVVSLLSSRGESPRPSRAETPVPGDGSPVANAPSSASALVAPEDDPAEPAREATRPTPASEPERRPAQMSPVPIEAEMVEADVASDDASPTPGPRAPTASVRLVGRERALLDAVRGELSDSEPDDVSPPPPPPPEASSLTLQGTSVIGGRAVAVISEQRVFEGDFIEGARVVRIGEREVELELDGQRFTLTL